MPKRTRQGARTRHKNWAIDREAGMTYREIARRARVSPMAVYFALNPEKRAPYVPRGERLGKKFVARYTRLSEEEWAEVKARAKQAQVSASALLRRIVLGEAPPIVMPPESTDEPELDS